MTCTATCPRSKPCSPTPATVDGYLLGGDYALFGGWPAETVARLRELDAATWIRGNVDRWTADPQAAPDDDVIQGAIAGVRGGARPRRPWPSWARSRSGRRLADWLVVHGSPLSDVRVLRARGR